MLPLPEIVTADQGVLLSVILKALRRHRGLRSREVAKRMGLPSRTYQLFEAGRGRLNLERLQRFADATNTDAWAILASLAFGAPDFALQCAENKLMTAAMESARDFHREWSTDIARLDPRIVMHELDAAWRRLGEAARQRRYPGREDPPDTL
jgi:transcriptional regulator with XRE-family HTH domain